MVRIRLRRVGAKKQPSYRVVVADSRAPRDGRFIETIGHYNPRTDPPTVVIHEDRAIYWLSVGAQPSQAVARFFGHLGLAGKVKDVLGGAAIEEVAAPRAAPEPGRPTKKRPPKKKAMAEAEPEDVTAEPAPEIEPVEAEAEAAPEPVEAEAAEVEEVVEEPAAELSLADLGLSTRVANVLGDAGVKTAAELAGMLADGEDKLLDISGIGAKAIEEIRQQLTEHGLDI